MKKISIFLMMLCFACFGVAKAQTELMTENFDGMSSIATSYSATGWFAYNAGNGNNWTISTSSTYAHSGSNSAQVQYNTSYAANCYLVSAPFTTSSNMTEISVSLYERARSSYYQETFEVFFVKASDVTTAASVTSATQYNAISSQDYTNETYAEVSGSNTSSALAGQSLRVVVHCTSIADRYYLNIDDITVSDNGVIACPKPANLEVTNDGATATATWEGDATDYNISINGSVTNNVTSPYTFEVETSTSYTVMVEANCTGETSGYCNPVTFTVQCLPQDMCSITLALTDSYGDGWNGGQMQVEDANTGEVYGTYTIQSGGSATYELALCPGTVVNFVYTAGSYGTENGWVIYDAAGEVITEEAGCNSGCTHTNGIQATYTMNCSGCSKPSNLQATNIGTETANLSWTGNSDSYVLQYRPWIAAGDDVLPTATMTPYTFDLSQYSGTGSVVIRHYDVTNMFRLIVDDIQVTNAAGTVVYSQDFEDCGGVMPSEFSLMDMDGDGYNWEVVTNSQSYVNGTYGLSSASWNSTAGALTPDNWIILSGIELGGSITFSARGQDANFAAENFCVYVCPDNALVEIPVDGTTYAATGLVPHAVYAWQVKGVCGDEESNYASAMFQTLDDVLVFATEGAWDNLSNWTDALGNAATALPTINDKVQINANVTIPNGVVAYAKKATLNGGEITIADGGQLKMDATAVVTIEKVIEGYDGNDGYYYFIASPLTTTMLNYSEGWSYVNALTDNYDLYTFDATAEDGLEWINFKSNSAHANFTSGQNNPVFVSGNGYLYANETTTTLQFEGSTAMKSYNNVETKEFSYDAASTDDWNGWELVGNPYTCNAYINYVDADGNVLDADFYTLNLDNTYSLLSSNQPLAPCTGAFVNYNATGKVQFASEATSGSNRTGLVNMNVSRNNKNLSQARIRFGQGHNLSSMSFRNNSSRIYMPIDGNDYAVVYTENQGEMPVSFKAEENGSYTLSFNIENIELGYLHLIDNMTGNDVDLLSTPSYSFEAKTTDYVNRFKLVFATGNADDMFAFYSNGSFVINNEGMATVQVIDINGRILSSESINGCANVSVNAATGVYMLRLINGENVKVQKVVVK